MRPSAIKHNRSNLEKTSLDGWWMVQMMVFPCWASFCMQSTIDIAINESSPLVGSSQNNKLGLVMSSQANASRRRSPPDMPLMPVSTDPISVSSHFFKLSFKFHDKLHVYTTCTWSHQTFTIFEIKILNFFLHHWRFLRCVRSSVHRRPIDPFSKLPVI